MTRRRPSAIRHLLGENIRGRAEWKLRGKEKTVNGKAEYEMMIRIGEGDTDETEDECTNSEL